MGVAVKSENSSNEMVIAVSGRFDFSFHQEFRDAYKKMGNASRVVVDMTATEYLDSSALGMLLLLREHSGRDAGAIEIRGCNESIKKVLLLSNFDKMFTIK